MLDDHPLVRTWLGQLIEQQADLSVCGEANSCAGGLTRIGNAAPDLAIMDISLPDGSGLDLIKRIKKSYPDLRMLVFSMHDERLYAERAIRAGAGGYVMKTATADGLIAAIYKTLRGKLAVSDVVERTFAEKYGENALPPDGPSVELLTDRELEIFQLIGKGADSREISRKLDISIKTVQAHCANMKLKLQLETASELLREAFRWSEFQ